MRVVRSLKGDAPSPIVFADRASYFPDPSGGPDGLWAGSSGACGILDADPSGQYALVVFERHEDELRTSIFMGAVFRPDPDDPVIARFRHDLEGRLVPGEPPRIVPTPAARQAWLTAEGMPLLLTAGVLATAFLALAGLWLRDRWRNA
jgi:hypothetical protein